MSAGTSRVKFEGKPDLIKAIIASSLTLTLDLTNPFWAYLKKSF